MGKDESSEIKRTQIHASNYFIEMVRNALI